VGCTPIYFKPASLFFLDLLTKFDSPEYFPYVLRAEMIAEAVCSFFALLRKALTAGRNVFGSFSSLVARDEK